MQWCIMVYHVSSYIMHLHLVYQLLVKRPHGEVAKQGISHPCSLKQLQPATIDLDPHF